MEFGCSVCGYTSTQKEHVVNHINRKKSCGLGIKEIIEIPVDIECQYCQKKFSTSRTLERHQKNSCKNVTGPLEIDEDSSKKRIGLIAQEVEKVFSKLVNDIELDNKKNKVIQKEIKQTPAKPKNEFKNFSKINKLIDKYIYLIQVYPYDENIFKLGRSGDIVNRLNAYKRFKIVSITSCEDEIRCEKDLLIIFRKEFEEYKDMGNEYFKGDGKVMNDRIYKYYYDLSLSTNKTPA